MTAQKTPLKHSAPSKRHDRAEADLESYRDIADDVIESDFVPYACLYDRDTIATKNGELVQIIRIGSLGAGTDSTTGSLRSAIRTAIRQCLPDTSYAVWLHTIRRKQGHAESTRFADPFSESVDAAWRAQHPVNASFGNELYITIVKAAQQANLSSGQALLQSLWPPRDRIARTAYLDRSLTELARATADLLNTLRPYGARLLTTVERDGTFYGEHIEFLEKLINLEQRPMPIPQRDLSYVLTSGEISFGFNAMEVRTAEDHRRFAAILTVKEYKESTLAGIDSFLEIPCELIVTQCFDFVGATNARQNYERQARYLAISGDAELAKWVEIDRLTSVASTDKTFGEQQTTLFLIAPSIKQLEANVRMVQRALSRLGMVVIREDLRFEDCYWAQLPGNFPFIARKHAVDTEHLAGFANLQRQPMGSAQGSPWGPPVSLLTTVQDMPYYFNFHRGNSAHTILTGRQGSGRTTLAHFLLSQSRKLPARIWYLDLHGRAGAFVKAIGGEYVTPGTASLKLNPLALEPTKPNRDFLALWLSTLIDPYGAQLNKTSIAFFTQLIDEVMKLPPGQRRLSALVPIARTHDPVLAQTIVRFAAGGEFGELFDMPNDQMKPGKVTAFDLSRWRGNDTVLVPLVSYLLHRLTMALDSTPTILVLDEAFELLKTPLFGPRAAAWLDFLTQHNTSAFLMTSDIETAALYPHTSQLAAKAASILALPDDAPGSGYMTGLGLNENDLGALGYMRKSERHVLLKRGEEATLLKVRLDGLGPNLPSLSGIEHTIPMRSMAGAV